MGGSDPGLRPAAPGFAALIAPAHVPPDEPGLDISLICTG